MILTNPAPDDMGTYYPHELAGRTVYIAPGRFHHRYPVGWAHVVAVRSTTPSCTTLELSTPDGVVDLPVGAATTFSASR